MGFATTGCGNKADGAKGGDKAATAAKSSATTCKALSTKVVGLLAEQGTDAMLQAKDIPMLTKGCEAGKTLETSKDDVACVMKLTNLKGMDGCKGANKMLKDMMKNAG